MHDDLHVKRSQVSYCEVPVELLANSFSKNVEEEADNREAPGKQKKQKKTNPNNWRPKLKAALQKPLAEAGNPTFTRIMNFCNKTSFEIIPKDSRVCGPNLFLAHVMGEKLTSSMCC